MKTPISILIIGIFFPVLFFGQGETNNWYFGFGAGLQFSNNGNVIVLTDGQLNSFEGCATISSSNGKLLFYTDGATVYDRNHKIMQNGTGLAGNPSSSQSALIVPKPDDPLLYYIITVDATAYGVRGKGLNYSIVDITSNNGNGAVIQKNINLLEDCAEKVTAVIKDCEGGSVWVIALASETGARTSNPIFNTYHAFELNSVGFTNTVARTTFNTLNTWDDRGYLKIAPNGSKLASANSASGLYIYDFDVITGLLSNQQQIVITSDNRDPYGIEFSPNSRFLYVHASNNLYATSGHASTLLQFDVSGEDISSSQVILDERNIFRGALQLGNDGRIYRTISESYENGTSYLGIINNPDMLGIAADYQHNAFELKGNLGGQGLPPFVQSFFNEVDLTPNDSAFSTSSRSLCVGESFTLEAQAIPGATYTWEKDGIPFTNPSANIVEIVDANALDSGNYQVTIVRPNALDCPIIGKTSVLVGQMPETNSNPLIVCDLDEEDTTDGITSFDLGQHETNSNNTYFFYETTLDRENDNPINSPQNYRNIQPFTQTIYYNVHNITGCVNFGEFQLQIEPTKPLTLQNKYFICTENPDLILTGPDGFDSYNWFKMDGSSEQLISLGQIIEILEIGSYFLEVRRNYDNNGATVSCSRIGSFDVQPSNVAVIDQVLSTGFPNTTIEVIVSGDGDYEFSIDRVNYQDTNVFDNLSQGMVTVYVNDKNGCGTSNQNIELKPSLPVGTFPNFFTPNGDGFNDFWQCISLDNAELNIENIRIYNRLGSLIGQVDPRSKGWDGNFNGQPLPASDYWFKAISFDGQEVTGHFALKR